MKTLVTGGAGFIGSHLVDLLLEQGHEVTVLDNLCTGRLANLRSASKNRRFDFQNVDVSDLKTIEKRFRGIDWVFHLAARADIVPSIKNPRDYFESNVCGTFVVLEAVRKHHVKRFLYAASSSCYGIPHQYPTTEQAPVQPQYPYALTKWLGEQMVLHWGQVYKMPVISLRLFNVYGPRSRTSGTYGAVFGVFLAQKLNRKPFTIVGDGSQTRDFTYVGDVAKAFQLAAESSLQQRVFNVGTGKPQSINRLAELLQGSTVHIPKRPGEPDSTHADIGKIQSALNWVPEISFEKGVKVVLDHIEDWTAAPTWTPNTIKNATKDWFKYLGSDKR